MENDPKAFFEWAKNKWEPGLILDKDKLHPDKLGIYILRNFAVF